MLNDSVIKNRDKLALIFPDTGETLSFYELEEIVIKVAAWLISLGLEAGDGIALLMENRPEFIVIGRAAAQAGLYFTPISTHLATQEITHILDDSGAKLLIASDHTLDRAKKMLIERSNADRSSEELLCFSVDSSREGFKSYSSAIDDVVVPEVFPDRPLGREMLYSSGTTGKPKGIRRALTPFADRHKPEAGLESWQRSFQIDGSAIYLSPAPLYHAAPLRYCMRVLNLGGTCVIMKKFDAQRCLEAIDAHCVTHSQWVPTMFVRMLELEPEVRAQYKLTTMKMAVHAAAPCSIHVKEAMLAWWGDIINEYYAGSEVAGTTWITPQEWREHRGSVGRPILGKVHIVGESGEELGPDQIGRIYFSGAANFAYLNDPEKTKSAYNDKGWATYGDIGHVDRDGYLYLSDRRDDLILSGGVNIYPFEIESVLSKHSDVQDVAIIGVPDKTFGEVPKAIVQLRMGLSADISRAQSLIDFAQSQLAKIKLPRTIVFEPQLPRLETGKLLRRVLKEKFRNDPESGFAIKPSESILN